MPYAPESGSDGIIRFRRSHVLLNRFFGTWIERIEERCKKPSQRRAAFYVWARYSMSMNTLAVLANPRLLPDVAVICRGCVEFDVALEAVLKDEGMASEYLEFDKHAKARYLKILREQGDLERLLLRTGQFEDWFGTAPEAFRDPSWCAKKGGITGLMRSLKRDRDIRLYNMLSHFVHGSISAMQLLDRRINPVDTLGVMLLGISAKYLSSSRSFLWSMWGRVVTPESERCKHEFLRIMTSHVEQAP